MKFANRKRNIRSLSSEVHYKLAHNRYLISMPDAPLLVLVLVSSS